MTTSEFLALPARERDALVAKHIFPEIRIRAMCTGFDTEEEKLTWHYVPYTTDIAAAWTVVEKLEGCNTKGLMYHDVYVQWQCVLDFQRRTFYDCRISVMADTAPLAICLAALKATNAINGE